MLTVPVSSVLETPELFAELSWNMSQLSRPLIKAAILVYFAIISS